MLANIPNFLRTIIPTCLLLVPSLGHAQFNEPDFGNHPSPAEVRKVVEARRDKIQGCFKERSQSMPERLDVQFTIWKDGGVNWASIDDSGIKDPSVTRCVRDVILLTNFPPPKVEIAKISYPFFFGDSKPPTSQGIVYNVIMGGSNDVEQCYRRALMTNPDLAGKVRVEFVIGTDGTVHSQKVVETSLNNTQAEDCILGVFSKMKFPKPKGGEVIVTFPFVFRPPDQKDESSKVEPKETRYNLAVIADHAEAINQCYSDVNDPSTHPGVRVRFLISKSGIPEAFSAPMSSGLQLTRCVMDVVQTMRFRPTNREIMMNYPFKFKDEAKDDGEAGSTDKSLIREEIRANRDLFKSCYELELQKDRELQGQIVLRFIIWQDESVIQSTVSSSSIHNQNLERCLHEALFELTFPRVPGIVIVNYPFNFST